MPVSERVSAVGDFIYVATVLSARNGVHVAALLPCGTVVVRRFAVEDGRRLLRALDPVWLEVALSRDKETMVLGAVAFVGRRV